MEWEVVRKSFFEEVKFGQKTEWEASQPFEDLGEGILGTGIAGARP